MTTFDLSKGDFTIGTPEFWALYDWFCAVGILELYRDRTVWPEISPEIRKLREVMSDAHRNHTHIYHRLDRPEKRWTCPSAWIALKSAHMRRLSDGELGRFIQVGDVFLVEHGWDRDVMVTHAPIEGNMVCGEFTRGAFEELVGQFMPLFSRATIIRMVDMRLQENLRLARVQTAKIALEWGYPE